VLCLAAFVSRAEQLPIRAWTTADGLPHNHINRIRRDSRGYLWICTDEGLARFDGYRFVNYGTAQGLPSLTVNDFIEARDGTYWVATDGGVCLFNPLGKAAPPNTNQPTPMFTVYRVSERGESNHVNGLLEDPDGSLWLATSGGLFHLRRTAGQAQIDAVEIGYPHGMRDERHVTKLFFDSRGTLWAMAISGLYRRAPEGRWERYGVEQGLRNNFVQSMFEDSRGRLWLGSRSEGLHLLVAHPQAGRRIVEKTYAIRDGLPGMDVRNITLLPDGRVWLSVVGGLVLFNSEASDESRFLNYTTAHGLVSNEIYNLTQDNEGNLWVGTRNSGVMRIAGSGLATFGAPDGFTPGPFNTMLESDDSELLIYNGSRTTQRFFHYFDGQKFGGAEHKLAAGFGYSREQAILQDRFGEWWVATDEGVHRYASVKTVLELARAKPKAIYGPRNGLAYHYVERLFEDRPGDIWIGTGLPSKDLIFLHRWERATDKIHRYKLPDNIAPAARFSAIGEDAHGNLWLANAGAPGLLRYRDGQFQRFTVADGAPANTVNAFFLDSKKRLWIATSSSGLHRLDEVSADRLRLTTWDVTKGLATNEILSVTEDQWGRIYAGTGRGVDRLDPETGDVRHFTSDDGLAKGEARVSLRDRNNHLWFVTEQGVSRLVPALDQKPSSLPVLITAVRVNGNPAPVSELGATRIDGLTLSPDQNSVQIDFLSLDFSAGAKLRYQYRLGEQDWSEPSELRTINFAILSPGVYRFSVRAISSSGVTSDPPAVVTFTINRPLWQRWWFIAGLAAGLGAMIYGLYRYRLGQALKVERMRTSIAQDLHDDIGANLTRISILSEVAKQKRVNDAPPPDELLDSIAEISRESVAAMNDIVWAISPEHDSLLDLTRRMRRHAEEVFTTRDIKLDFQAPDGAGELKLNVEMRRDLYLVFKEAVNNAARHADCSAVSIKVWADGAKIFLAVSDDGKGFDPAELSEGHGLLSMRNRARAVGGELVIESSPGAGSEVRLSIPL
jgi:ligand-binding sensor domain-containing protein/two-component sensor histidine kinase